VKPKVQVTPPPSLPVPPPGPIPPPGPVPSPGATATKPKWTNVFGRGGDERAAADKLECLTDGDRIVAYVSMEFSQAHSKMDDRFPEVTFTAYRPIIFFRLQESVDIGIGVGFNRFSGNGFPKTEFEGKNFHFWRKSLPMRARFFAPGLKSGSRWRGIQLVLQTDYLRAFTTADFMAPAGPKIESGFVSSAFLGIDLLTLASPR
jgi:hypothetical protein